MIKPKLTPQQVNQQTQKETKESEQQQQINNVSKIEAKDINKNTPPNLKPSGSDKLAIFLNKNRSKIIAIFLPILTDIALKAGIQNIGTPQVKLPDTCLTQKELDRILKTRNQLVNRLNNIVKTLDTLSKILTGFNLALGIFTTLLSTLKNTRIGLNIAMSFFPGGLAGTPGILPASINNLETTEKDIITPKLEKITGALAAASLALSLINVVLLKVIGMLNSIDAYIKKCSPDSSLTPLSPTLLEIEKINKEIDQQNNPNNQTYQGFILEIITEPYSPTVNRRKAVAKNRNGIILLQTPLSFTTLDEVLIQEIKLIIDSNNLKAD